MRPVGIGAKPISDAGLSHDETRNSGITHQFPAQITHRDAQQMHRILILSATPELVNQLVVSSDEPGVMDKNLQKIVLRRCQFYLLIFYEHFAPVEVNPEFAGLEDFDARASKGAPQGGPKPRQEFAHRERLREIVVSARIEARDFFGLLMSHGHHDDGRSGPFP